MRNPILVALDVASADEALQLAGQLAPVVGGFKIGSELFTAAGPDIVKRIRRLGAPVFLDLKFHDIPNTVAKAVASAVRLDVQMLTIHTGGAKEMMAAAEKAAQQTAAQLSQTPPLVLGVTVLTSMDAESLGQVGVEPNPEKQVVRLATLAREAGLRGLVCSPREVAELRRVLPESMQLVVPGIRAAAVAGDDQKRTLSPREAIKLGATWLVIGRPIYAADNPRASAEQILQDITR